MAGDEAKPADEAPDDAEAPPQPAQPQTQSLYPKFMYDSRDTPEGEQEKTLPPDELRRLALPSVLGGGVRRVAGETYPNALLTDGWPGDGLLLARSAVAERILVDRYGADRGAVGRDHPQWWPARAISIEEYLEYYATTLAKHRPKFDHVAVVFLRPWWSEHLADDGVARMFELEPAPAKATHVRPLAGSDPAPPSRRRPPRTSPRAASATRCASRARCRATRRPTSARRASPATGRDAEGWERRRARLAEAYGNSSASPRDKKRDPPRDVSTAHVDVVNYPSVVLTLPWRRASRRRRGNARTSRRSSARGQTGDFDERAFRDAVRRDGAPAEAEALPPSVFRPASPTLEALPAADVTEEDSEARSSKASSESPPASPKDNPEVARAAESKDGGEEDSGGEAPMERDDDDAPPAADDGGDGGRRRRRRGGGRRGGGGGGAARGHGPTIWGDAHNRLFDAAAFDRASRRDCPSLAPPEDAPVDGSRPLVYLGAGDDVEDCGDRCHKASSQTKRALLAKHDADRHRGGPAAGSSARHVAPELWLYLAARGADRSRAGLARVRCPASSRTWRRESRRSSATSRRWRCRRRRPRPRPARSGPGLRPRGAQAQEARAAASGDGGGGSSGDDDASPRSDEGADDRDLRRARRERVAVLEVLEKVDRCVQQLVNKDDAALRDACAAAATAHNDAELILTKVVAAQAAGVGGSPTRDRVAAAEARVAAASSAASRGPRPGPARAEEAPEPLRRRGDGGARGGREADADLPAYEWAGARRPRTLAIYDRRCRLHETKVYCMEQSRRAVAAAAVVEAAALRHPTRLWVERSVHEGYLGRATALLSYAHSRVYVSAVRRRCLDLKTNATMLFGGEDEDTCGNRHTWDASLAASAAVLQAVDAVVSGEAKNALCAVRPGPAAASVNALGAESNGYCILNHAALGAKYAAHERGLQRVAVFDFDVHHGNGTEDVLARTCDPRFMYLSLHACGRDVYPGSGKREVPDHPGVLNLPHAYEEPMTAEWCHAYAMPKVLKALDGFRPDLLILSSGFDAHKRDPVDLGRFDASDYGDLTRACVDWARRNCCGRVVSVLEGGYGVDCGPAGEYVQSGRREAFDTRTARRSRDGGAGRQAAGRADGSV
ncbi:NAD-dependent histone deacetylase [Aureococcus anophagefferens]|nr:NAD-dependent histone deacetylase [Aureococcus anophagefferens]